MNQKPGMNPKTLLVALIIAAVFWSAVCFIVWLVMQ